MPERSCDNHVGPDFVRFRLERVRAMTPQELAALPVPVIPPPEEEEEEYIEEIEESVETEAEPREAAAPRGERPALRPPSASPRR